MPYLDDEDEPNNGGGIFWENNGQPIKILQRGKEDAVADEDLLLGWDMKEKQFCGQLVSSKDNLLTVIFNVLKACINQNQIDLEQPDWLASPPPTPARMTTTVAVENGEEKKMAAATKLVPLLEHLCAHFNCTLKGLQLNLTNLEMRRWILDYCRQLKIHTTHIRPKHRNPRVYCQDISIQNSSFLHALNGYLGITVRQYFMVKHGRKLRHPYLPCLIEHGGIQRRAGRNHRSFYPLEVLAVELEE